MNQSMLTKTSEPIDSMKTQVTSVSNSNRTWRRWSRRVVLRFASIVLGCGFALVVCEVFLRVFIEQEVKRLAIYDPDLGWRGRPNGKGIYVRKADGIRVPFRYNNIGYRDEDVLSKKPRQRRVMLLGDSFIENLEVEFEKTFPALIEKRLRQTSVDWDTVVIGSQGYSTAQELLAFRKFKDVVKPDVVVQFFYCGNDFEDNLRRSFAFLDDNRNLQITTQKDPWWKIQIRTSQRWLYESSHVVFLVKNQLQSIAAIELTPSSKSVVDSDEDYKRQITSQLIEKLSKEVTQSGASFLVVIIPFRDDLKEGKSDRPQYIFQECNKLGVNVLDLTDFLSAQKHYFETDIHFNTDGHKVVAQTICELLERGDPIKNKVAK